MKTENKLILGDAIKEMEKIKTKSIDLVLCDMPYGTTKCRWDELISIVDVWKELKRIRKPISCVIFTSSQPFTSVLTMSNIKEFRYSWIWNKKLAGNAILAKKQPLKIHEDILVFGSNTYTPIMRKGKMRNKNGIKNKLGTFYNAHIVKNDLYYPTTILEFSNAPLRRNKVHLAQKPVELFEYLIKTYTKPEQIVLDFTMGSGTTGVACVNTGRNFIGIEIDKEYFNIAKQRIDNARKERHEA